MRSFPAGVGLTFWVCLRVSRGICPLVHLLLALVPTAAQPGHRVWGVVSCFILTLGLLCGWQLGQLHSDGWLD